MVVFVETFAPPSYLDDFSRDYDLPPKTAMQFNRPPGNHDLAPEAGLTDALLAQCAGPRGDPLARAPATPRRASRKDRTGVDRIVGDPLVGTSSQLSVLAAFALVILPAPWWVAAGLAPACEPGGSLDARRGRLIGERRQGER